MIPDEIGGLPAHPLLVHLPLVLGPVVGLLALALLIPRLRERLLGFTLLLAIVFAVSALLAVASGEAFADERSLGGAINEHEEAAELLRLLALALAAALALLWAGRRRLPAAGTLLVAVAVAVLGVATIGATIRTGHEGATLVWQGQGGASDDD